LLFSVEYTVEDVESVLEDAINKIVSAVIDDETVCEDPDQDCQYATFKVKVIADAKGKAVPVCFISSKFQLHASLKSELTLQYSSAVCLEYPPIHTIHHCAFVNVLVTLRSSSPVEDLRSHANAALRWARKNGSFNALVFNKKRRAEL